MPAAQHDCHDELSVRVVAAPRVAMEPVRFDEDAAARRWLAARLMRVPLVVLKFGSPVLTIAALALIVEQSSLGARPGDALWVLALPFGVPFLMAAVYPVLRWSPQSWVLDAAGIHGRGRVRVSWPWSAVASWRFEAADRLPSHVRVVFRHAGGWRRAGTSMMVRAIDRPAVEAWFRSRPGPN